MGSTNTNTNIRMEDEPERVDKAAQREVEAAARQVAAAARAASEKTPDLAILESAQLATPSLYFCILLTAGLPPTSIPDRAPPARAPSPP